MLKAKIGLCLPAALVLFPCVAHAEEREFCADRPGLGTPACTLAPGTAMIELGAASWDHSRDPNTVDDEVTVGDVLLRVGVTPTTEVQLGLSSHVIQRTRDRATGEVDRVTGVGDGTVAVRQSLSGPNGHVAVQAYVTVPLVRRPIGSGEWSGGILLPTSFALAEGLDFEFIPQVSFEPNESRPGHHVAWGAVAGLSQALGDRLSLTGEIAAVRDDDPDGGNTDTRLAASLAWQVADKLQIDLEADAGLSSGAPDRTLAIGVAWQFH